MPKTKSTVLDNLIISTEWTIDRYHGVTGKKRRWRLTRSGIEIQGAGYPTSRAQPHLSNRVCTEHESPIRRTLDSFALRVSEVKEDPVALRHACLLAATICTESAGNPNAKRFEKHLNDYSFGLTQMLTSTAFAVGRKVGWPTELPLDARRWQMPKKPVPKGGTPDEWQKFLGEPYHACLLALTLHQLNDGRFGCQGDPIIMSASYNAGSPRRTDKNKWGLVSTAAHLDAFVQYFNDAARFYLAGTDLSPDAIEIS